MLFCSTNFLLLNLKQMNHSLPPEMEKCEDTADISFSPWLCNLFGRFAGMRWQNKVPMMIMVVSKIIMKNGQKTYQFYDFWVKIYQFQGLLLGGRSLRVFSKYLCLCLFFGQVMRTSLPGSDKNEGPYTCCLYVQRNKGPL